MKKTPVQHSLLRLLDWAGLSIAIVVQLGVMTVSMMRLAPGPLEMVGFILSGAAIVLFAPRAFSKWMELRRPRYLVNYIMLELVTLFFGWSFVVSGTVAQTDAFTIEVTPQNDVVLIEYYDQRDRLERQLQNRREEFDQSVRAETIQNIQSEQQRLQEELRRVNVMIQNRMEAIADGRVTDQMRSRASRQAAEAIFTAIPDAVEEGRSIQVFIWFLFMGSISLMIINSLTDGVRHNTKGKSKSKSKTRKKQRRKWWQVFLKSKKTIDQKSAKEKSSPVVRPVKPINFADLQNLK